MELRDTHRRGNAVLDKVSAEKVRPFLELKAVEVVYPNGTAALKPVNIDLSGNEVTVLLGPSGAGKSTLLRVLNRLVIPSKGQVFVRDLGELKSRSIVREHRLRTGMVFQQHQLLARLSALQNVLLSRVGNYSFLRSLFPLPKHERIWALECLERVGLLEKALERCDALSGGQQQRVGIARTLAQRPNLILADEPVASLDPASSERVLSTLKNISRQDNVPVIISLHQLEYARSFADRIVGLSRGEVVFDGAPGALDDVALERIYGDRSQA
jgi:phosphonate transport system ATP-binding protein